MRHTLPTAGHGQQASAGRGVHIETLKSLYAFSGEIQILDFDLKDLSTLGYADEMCKHS